MQNRARLLIIEKNKKQQRYLENVLSDSYAIKRVSSVAEADSQLQNIRDFSLALISLIPPENFSSALLKKMKSLNPRMSVILLASREHQKPAVSLLEQGIVDHIASTDNPATILSSIKNEHKKRELEQRNEFFRQKLQRVKSNQEKNLKRALDLEDIYDTTLENLMTALDLRDVETFGHSRTVAKYSQILAQILGIRDKNRLDNIRKGALLHDVGKIAIPDSILKKPSSLTAQEWEKIRLHPSLGFGLIKEIKFLKEAGNIILYHHERYDGNGYPRGLKKEKIPMEARIFALADALDAITSYRPYRKERDFRTAKEEIQANSGTQFDPDVVEAFNSLSLDDWEKIRFETTKLLPAFEEMKSLV
jgi:putative nucleotidyltransferase with HDIG domain